MLEKGTSLRSKTMKTQEMREKASNRVLIWDEDGREGRIEIRWVRTWVFASQDEYKDRIMLSSANLPQSKPSPFAVRRPQVHPNTSRPRSPILVVVPSPKLNHNLSSFASSPKSKQQSYAIPQIHAENKMGSSGEGNGKQKDKYNSWSERKNVMLLELLYNAVIKGGRDSSGVLNKKQVEREVLPILNESLGCNITYDQYKNRMKTLKKRYSSIIDLQRHSSGFGWNPQTKLMEAPDEIWGSYFEGHPTASRNIRDEKFAGYEYLTVIFGKSMASGRHSVGLGNSTDARTNEAEPVMKEVAGPAREELVVLEDTPPGYISSSAFEDTNLEAATWKTSLEKPPKEKYIPRKKSKTSNEEQSSSAINARADLYEQVASGMLSIKAITTEIQGMRSLMEKRNTEKKNNNLWDAIKEIPNLHNQNPFKVLELVTKMGIKNEFLSMSPEERSDWIAYNLN